METPSTRDHPASPDAIRQELHAWIEQGGDEFCAKLHPVLRFFIEEAAPVGQDSEPPGPRP